MVKGPLKKKQAFFPRLPEKSWTSRLRDAHVDWRNGGSKVVMACRRIVRVRNIVGYSILYTPVN